jgi:hypothetical protein
MAEVPETQEPFSGHWPFPLREPLINYHLPQRRKGRKEKHEFL